MNVFQESLMHAVNEFAQRYRCVRRIFIFGSVAKGETEKANDIDISIDYHSDENIVAIDMAIFQADVFDWKDEVLPPLFNRPVGLTHPYWNDRLDPDEVWHTVRNAPVIATVGKAVMVLTPPHAKIRE